MGKEPSLQNSASDDAAAIFNDIVRGQQSGGSKK